LVIKWNYKVKLPNQPSPLPKREFKTRGVSHSGLAIYIKRYLKAKEEVHKLKYFTMPKYNFSKIQKLKEIKILQDIITL
jgi:hypothetical protein